MATACGFPIVRCKKRGAIGYFVDEQETEDEMGKQKMLVVSLKKMLLVCSRSARLRLVLFLLQYMTQEA